MRKLSTIIVILSAFGLRALCADLQISIGIRETGNPNSLPTFANGGSTGGIEFVNRDGPTLIVNGTWQLFTFTPSVDTLTAFAGATANSVLDSDWVVLEQIRVLNSGGITAPIRLWIDNISNTTTAGTVTEGFESFALDSEAMFQEPRFSGSTSGNLLLTPNASLVSASDAYSGIQSDEINFQFLDNDPTRWVRLTTFNTANLPNPLMLAREVGAPAPTISFYAKAIMVPEPSALALGMLGVALCACLKRRQSA